MCRQIIFSLVFFGRVIKLNIDSYLYVLHMQLYRSRNMSWVGRKKQRKRILVVVKGCIHTAGHDAQFCFCDNYIFLSVCVWLVTAEVKTGFQQWNHLFFLNWAMFTQQGKVTQIRFFCPYATYIRLFHGPILIFSPPKKYILSHF